MSTPLFSSFPADERQKALYRFQIIQPFLSDGIHLSDIAPGAGVSLRTARRWVTPK
jgi:hypothetical protein